METPEEAGLFVGPAGIKTPQFEENKKQHLDSQGEGWGGGGGWGMFRIT